MLDTAELNMEIEILKRFWNERNSKFKDWYEILTMVDLLASKGMESYVSNEPSTFYRMAHYLLCKGELQHLIPISAESALDLDNRAKVHRACQYMWSIIDRGRKLGGNQSFVDDLGFYILLLGWYSIVTSFNPENNLIKTQLWNPSDVYPRYANEELVECLHSYSITDKEAKIKAQVNGWQYKSRIQPSSSMNEVTLDDFFIKQNGIWFNKIRIDGQDVTDWVDRNEMLLLIAPVSGFPDKGSLSRTKTNWKVHMGKGIFEANEKITTHFNKWKSIVAQILRDTAQPVTQEFSATPQATPEQLRERGGLFHYAPGEAGLQRLPSASIPIELQSNLLEIRREMQKGSFNDSVYGMLEGQTGYALNLLSTSSVNQILSPFLDGKNFAIGEIDSFWLSSIKKSGKTFQVKGKLIEQIKPQDIPDEVQVLVESEAATPKDWLERGTIGGMLREDLDETTLLTEIYKVSDPQGVIRRKTQDQVMKNPTTQQIQLINGYQIHADYLDSKGDRRQANLFRKAAQLLEQQLGAPAPGQGQVSDMTRIQAQRDAGTPSPVATVPSKVIPPEETGGFTPTQLRKSIGRGKLQVSQR